MFQSTEYRLLWFTFVLLFCQGIHACTAVFSTVFLSLVPFTKSDSTECSVDLNENVRPRTAPHIVWLSRYINSFTGRHRLNNSEYDDEVEAAGGVSLPPPITLDMQSCRQQSGEWFRIVIPRAHNESCNIAARRNEARWLTKLLNYESFAALCSATTTLAKLINVMDYCDK